MDSTDRVDKLPGLESCFAKSPGLKSCLDKFLRERARTQAILQAHVPNAARARNAASENGDLDHVDDDISLGIPIWMIREGVNPTREQLQAMRQDAAVTSSDRQEAAATSTDRQEAASTSSDRQEAAATSSDRQEAVTTSSDRQVGMKSKREVPNEEDYDSEEEEAPAAANGNYKTTSIGNKAEASTSTSTVKTN